MIEISAEIVAKATAQLGVEIEKELMVATPLSKEEIDKVIASNVVTH